MNSVSVLDTLKALAARKSAPVGSPVVVQVDDPAIAGAKRNKNTVILGNDASIMEDAATCAKLKAALEDAQAQFAIYQSTIRSYGREKRNKYNDAFKASVTTVCVPYMVEVPVDPNSQTPGREVKHVQVICTNKYSVAQDTILASKSAFGEHYGSLFVEEVTKSLKPNAEDLIRGLLSELNVNGEELENLMSTLIDTTVKVKTAEGYETSMKKVPQNLRSILDQSVVRSEPGLKFT